MTRFTGKGVYDAIAVGKICVFKRQDIQVKGEMAKDTIEELARFEKAKAAAIAELEEIYDKVLKEIGEDNARIFEVHRMMIEDNAYNNSIREMLEVEGTNAEEAVTKTGNILAERFMATEGAYMQARAADIRDISNRILRCLGTDAYVENSVEEERILCVDDLAPSETVALNKDKILAFVTAHGSVNSHTAILAKNRNIPAVIGLGDEFLKVIKDNDVAIVNGFTGELILNPEEEVLVEALKKRDEEFEKRKLLKSLKGKKNVTLDGAQIDIFANIDSVDYIEEVLQNDADGIGLFRSEFIYLEKADYPTEEEQFCIYKRVLESMADRKVIIRTLDIGADKQMGYFGLEKEDNPAMGLRAIRLCLMRPEIFKMQLKALYRASVYGNLGIMFPMITGVNELEEILILCTEVKQELDAENIPYSEEVELGIMIETPAAAIISDRLAPMVDFVSIGTNDLIQYTLACDRQNAAVDRFCDTHHEAVLRLIEMSVRNAHAHGTRIGICGELATDTSLTEEFLRMGIDELSVSPSFVLKMRDVVRNIDLSKEK